MCAENIQQIYRKTHISKCDFYKVAKQVEIDRDSTILGGNCCARFSILDNSLVIVLPFWLLLCPSFYVFL